MFSRNGKISEKQMRRMLVLSVFGSSIFVLPYLSAKLFEENVMPGLLLFFGLVIVYVTCIYGIGAWYQKNRPDGFADVLTQEGITGKLLLSIQFLRLLLRLAFYIVLSVEILGEAQVPFMRGTETRPLSNLLVILPLLLVALYGACREIEKQGRLHEMIFWVLFVPFIVMLLFGLGEVDYSVFVPKKDASFVNLLFYSYGLLTFILPVEHYLYLRPVLTKRRMRVKDAEESEIENPVWVSYTAVLSVVALAILLSLFVLGIYGVHGAGTEEMVTISIMRYIRLPLGVLERFDVLMIWFFMTGCFVLICSTLYYAGHLLLLLFPGVKRIWVLIGILVAAMGLVMMLPGYSHTLLLFLGYGIIADIPLSLLIPLIGIGLEKLDTEEEENSLKEEGV